MICFAYCIGTQVFDLCSNEGVVCERVSIDEAYLDVTEPAFSLLRDPGKLRQEAERTGAMDSEKVIIIDKETTAAFHQEFWQRCLAYTEGEIDQDALLAAGAIIVAQVRKRVVEETGFTLSAGIARELFRWISPSLDSIMVH